VHYLQSQDSSGLFSREEHSIELIASPAQFMPFLACGVVDQDRSAIRPDQQQLLSAADIAPH
jgi:hypothetical protein